ncbi:MAG: flagellar hook-associated protein FlgK [Clostridiaceae bacterium]|nr:flagellar hook-associated protein FlgK [Clostridiaceae bacterium]
MASTFWGLTIAASGMNAYNAALNTTAHNIANVQTTGYSKQTVTQTAGEGLSLGTSYGVQGAGVVVTGIESTRDIYLDEKYRASNSDYGMYSTMQYYMDSIQDYLWVDDSDSGGITNAIDEFFTTISDLTTDATDTTKRMQVVSYAETLMQSINEAANNLLQLQEDANTEIADTVDLINAYAKEIASLTKQINNLEVFGTTANDLRDQRAAIIDSLSELVNVEVTEKEPADGNGLNQYIVSIGGTVLVDTYETNTLIYETTGTTNAQNDYSNLYTLRWSNGADFDMYDSELGGKLQGLIEIRDGNNGEYFSGTVTDGAKGSTTITIQGDSEVSTSLFKLDIPETDGVITVGNAEYTYDYFELTVDEDGTYTYTFYLDRELDIDMTDKTATIGDEVDYRGIPYYMSQLNEFVRTFSYYFNQIQTEGYDLNGDLGEQVFIATDDVSGTEMRFTDIEQPYTISSALSDAAADGYIYTSYYSMTALNASVDQTILKDGSLLACASAPDEVANNENLLKMSDLSSDTTMFRQGTPTSFLQVMISTAGVDGKKIETSSENAENLRDSVENRRLSVSGVDEDEEAQNLVICQNLLTYQYKVLSIMNEVLDKLINDTAV